MGPIEQAQLQEAKRRKQVFYPPQHGPARTRKLPWSAPVLTPVIVPHRFTGRDVIEVVGWLLNIPVVDVVGCHRQAHLIMARQACVYLLITELGVTYPRAGQLLNKDHTTILHARRRAEERLADGDGKFIDILMRARAVLKCWRQTNG